MAEPIPFPGRIIKSGETDKQLVRLIQQRLNELNCSEPPLGIDGDFGAGTVRAVKVFQSRATDTRQMPLKPDGQIGSITWAALFGEAAPAAQPVSPLLQGAIDTAKSQLGKMEDPLLSNSGPDVNQYLASVGLGPGFAWCAAFVHWCFDRSAERAGMANPVIKTAGVMDHWTKAGKAGITRIAGADAINNPALVKAGHIFVINFGGGLGHTGLVIAADNGIIHTIEGNAKPVGGLIRDGYGVFQRDRKVVDIKQGYIVYG